jgi:hypothetical protein
VSRLLTAQLAPIALLAPVPMAGAGCSKNFTQVVFGNPELLGP